MSQPAARPTIRRHEWLLAGIAALIAFVVPMTVVGWFDDPEPEIRVLETSERLSTLVVDGDARVLVINSDDREATGAFLGRIAQPWEPRPATIVVGSDDDSAIGLWEALQQLDPTTVVVAGIPGADPLWAAIEADCASRAIDLRYVSDRATLATERLSLTVFGAPAESERGRGIVVRRGNASVVITLGEISPPVDGQALIFTGDPSPAQPDLQITSDDTPRNPTHHEVLVDDRRAVRLVLGENDLRVFGGVLRSPVSGSE